MNRAQRRAMAREQGRHQAPTRRARVVLNAVDVLIEGAQPLDIEQRNRLQLAAQACLDALIEHRGTVEHGSRLFTVAQLSQVLVEQLAERPRLSDEQRTLHTEVLASVGQALQAMQAIETRTLAGVLPWGATTAEADHLRTCVDLHHQLLQLAPLAMVERAVGIAKQRISNLQRSLLPEQAL